MPTLRHMMARNELRMSARSRLVRSEWGVLLARNRAVRRELPTWAASAARRPADRPYTSASSSELLASRLAPCRWAIRG